MSANSSSIPLHGGWLTLAHAAWYACAALTAIVLLAAVPVYYNRFTQPIVSDPYGLGPFSQPFQTLVDLGDLAGSCISFALAVLLFWRKPSDRMALFVSFFCLVTATTGIFLLSNVLTASFGAPSTHELWPSLQNSLWVLLFCVFPDGRFVPRWTRWLFLISIPTSLLMFAGAEGRAISYPVNSLFIFLSIYAQIYRYRRVSSYAERQQTKWWLYGLFVAGVLFVIASLVYRRVSEPLVNVTPLFLTIAILRSRLWDIDIIIRKTLTYSLVITLLAIIYLGSVIAFQQIFANITGQRSEVITVFSTLVIAALFVPLRNRIQNAIDKRFYRRKYDAQKVLQEFGETARDETDLGVLTGRLIEVVQETMQPTSVSVWVNSKGGSDELRPRVKDKG